MVGRASMSCHRSSSAFAGSLMEGYNIVTVESFLFADGAEYIRPVDEDFLDDIELGSWSKPFPNEEGNSQAFGMVESFAQSDIGNAIISEHGGPIAYAVF